MEEEGDDKVDKSQVAEVLATPSKTQKPSKIETPLRRSSRKASHDADALAKSETVRHQAARNMRKTPAKNTPTRTPANDLSAETATPGRPKRAGTSTASAELLKPASIASTEPLESDNEERVMELASQEAEP